MDGFIQKGLAMMVWYVIVFRGMVYKVEILDCKRGCGRERG